MRKMPSSPSSRILADHLGQQSGRLGQLAAELTAVQDRQARQRVFGSRIDQCLPAPLSSQSICGLAVLA